MPLNLPPDLEARLRVVAGARGEDMNTYAIATLFDATDRDLDAALAEAEARLRRLEAEDPDHQKLLYGPARSIEESFAAMREKYGIADLSHLSNEELAEQTEATLAALPPEKRAEAERLGLI